MNCFRSSHQAKNLLRLCSRIQQSISVIGKENTNRLNPGGTSKSFGRRRDGFLSLRACYDSISITSDRTVAVRLIHAVYGSATTR